MGKLSVDIPRDTIIRRYMSFTRFEQLVKDQSLYFSRFDNFDDHLEGGINKSNFSSVSNTVETFDLAMMSWPGLKARNEEEMAQLEDVSAANRSQTFPSLFGLQKKDDGDAYLQHIRSWLYASCWSDLPHECLAMWQLYGSSGSNCPHDAGCTQCMETLGNSLCIETTVGAVEDNLKITDGYNLAIRKVEYLDHRKSFFVEDEMVFRPFFSKALHFSYENEVRFLLWPDRTDIKFSYKYKNSTINDVRNQQLAINSLERFIGKVILSPVPVKKASEIRSLHFEQYQSALGLQNALSNAPLKQKVCDLLKSRDLDIKVVDSDLNQLCVTDLYTLLEQVNVKK